MKTPPLSSIWQLNVESYDFYAGVDSDKELGRIYVEDMGTIDVPEEVRPFFDYAAYGRKVREDDKGCFVNDGYLMRSGLTFRNAIAVRRTFPRNTGYLPFPNSVSGNGWQPAGNERQGRPAQQARPRGRTG